MKRVVAIACMCLLGIVLSACGQNMPRRGAKNFEGANDALASQVQEHFLWEGYLGFDGEDMLVYFSPADYEYNNRENAVIIKNQQEVRDLWKLYRDVVYKKYGKVFPVDIEKMAGSLIAIQGTGKYVNKAKEEGCFKTLESIGLEDEYIFEVRGPTRFDNPNSIIKQLPPTSRTVAARRDGGDKSSIPMPASIYRVMWDPYQYEGKWVLVQGKLKVNGNRDRLVVSLGKPFSGKTMSEAVTLFVMNNTNKVLLEGSVIAGYSNVEETEPVINPEYCNAMCGAVWEINFEYSERGPEYTQPDYFCAGYVHMLNKREKEAAK